MALNRSVWMIVTAVCCASHAAFAQDAIGVPAQKSTEMLPSLQELSQNSEEPAAAETPDVNAAARQMLD